VWLTELSRGARKATLDEIPDAELDRIAKLGFDWVWLLSVWQTGEMARQIIANDSRVAQRIEETLPDLTDEDIQDLVSPSRDIKRMISSEAMRRWPDCRAMRMRGLRLMLDFVPNHTAPDHPWVEEHPEYYVRGTEEDLVRAPQNYTRVKRKGGDLVLAHGRDPYFPGWSDTLQLNYANAATQKAMAGELLRIAGSVTEFAVTLAMLVLPDVFERTWGARRNRSGRTQ